MWVGWEKKSERDKRRILESFLRGSDCSVIRMQDKFFRRLHMRCRERDRNQYSDTAKFKKFMTTFFSNKIEGCHSDDDDVTSIVTVVIILRRFGVF